MKSDIREHFSEDTYGTTAAVILTELYGAEWAEWEPEALSMEMTTLLGRDPAEFPGLEDRIQAVAAVLTQNSFHHDLVTFSNICSTLNFSGISQEEFLPAGLDDVLWGCTEVHLLEGDLYRENGFSPDVALYTGILLEQDGYAVTPKIIDFAIRPGENDLEGAARKVLGDRTGYKLFWDRQEDFRGGVRRLLSSRTSELIRQLQRLSFLESSTEYLQRMQNELDRVLSL
jgi:hypothetical protein